MRCLAVPASIVAGSTGDAPPLAAFDPRAMGTAPCVPEMAQLARMITKRPGNAQSTSTRRSGCPALRAPRTRRTGLPARRRYCYLRFSAGSSPCECRLPMASARSSSCLLGIQRLLGFPGLFVDLAGLDKAALRLVVFARGGLVALAFVARTGIPFVLFVLHATSFHGGAEQTGRGGATVPPPPEFNLCCIRSPGHDHRDFRLHDDVAGRAAEDHLADAALRVGALQHQIGAGRHRLLQERFALRLLPAERRAQADLQPVRFEVAGKLLAGRARLGHVLRPDGNDDDMLRQLEKRHRDGHGQRGLGAAVPGDRDRLAERRRHRFRHHHHRAAALEQRVLERRLGDRGELFRLFDDDQVVDPAAHPDDRVLPSVLLAPGGARAVIARRQPARSATPCAFHEIAEQPPRLVAAFVAFAFERAIDLRGDRKPHFAAEHDGIFGRQTVQPDDMAVEAAGDHQCRFEHRPRIAVADHGKKVFHDTLPCSDRGRMIAAHAFRARVQQFTDGCESGGVRCSTRGLLSE